MTDNARHSVRDDLTADRPERTGWGEPLAYACPRCAASPGRRCVGLPVGTWHGARVIRLVADAGGRPDHFAEELAATFRRPAGRRSLLGAVRRWVTR